MDHADAAAVGVNCQHTTGRVVRRDGRHWERPQIGGVPGDGTALRIDFDLAYEVGIRRVVRFQEHVVAFGRVVGWTKASNSRNGGRAYPPRVAGLSASGLPFSTTGTPSN